jgi:HAD superfamily hydrolase (TIGR01662 family)
MESGNLEILFFDLGNTLMYFDTSLDVVSARANSALYRKLAEFGINVSESEFMRTLMEFTLQSNRERNETCIEQTTIQTVTQTLAYLGTRPFSEEQIKQAVRALFSEYQDHWRLGDDTLETLEALQEWGYRMGIISNASDREDVRVLMKKGNLDSFFEHVIVSAEEGVRKPHPRIFQKGLRKFRTTPDHCVMVGDTLSADILGANQMGISSIWINRWADTVENRALREKVHPGATISHLRELLNEVKKRKKKRLSYK